MDTEAYREVLAPPPFDFTEWPTGQLKEHIAGLLIDVEYANLRRHAALEREIGAACFELTCRRQDYERFVEATGQVPDPRSTQTSEKEVTC